MEITLNSLAVAIGARIEGDGGRIVHGIASLEDAGAEDLSFVTEPRYAPLAEQTKAGAVIVPENFKAAVAASAAVLRVGNVDEALEKTLKLFAPATEVPPTGIHATAVISPTARLGENIAVGPGSVIGDGAVVGDRTAISAGAVIGRDVHIGTDCLIYPNVVVRQGSLIGDRVIIHPNATIGADGFGYRFADGKHKKIQHIGIVVIEDDVEIGANCCIDRAKFGRTVIGRGTKIDNLVQIAHNVKIGSHCIIVSQTGIAGSARLGKYVVLGGQVGVRDHVRIGDNVMVGATSAVDQDLEANCKAVGTPALPVKEFFRQLAVIQKLPQLDKQIKQIQARIDELGTSTDHRD
jgi:UDP-3-O-[3-hydroxymyristoyl] glucosamine N-acyltransferase